MPMMMMFFHSDDSMMMICLTREGRRLWGLDSLNLTQGSNLPAVSFIVIIIIFMNIFVSSSS